MKPELSDESVRAIHRALTYFGYPVDMEWVRATTARMIAGEKPVSGPAMMVQTLLRDAGIPCEAGNA